MKQENQGLTRRGFLQKGSLAVAAGAVGVVGGASFAEAKGGTFATFIDLTKCDGCKGVPIPKCVAACRQANEKNFPAPQEPIKDLWPQKTHDDWSKKKDVINTLTPYNWTTVQQVQVAGEEIYIPRRCMHCDNPPCANLCPFGALNQNADSSVVINPDLCLGGAKCKAVCPWGIPQRQSGVGIYLKMQPIPAGGGVMYKCDLCHDRLKKGQIPACVEACEKRLGKERPLFFGFRAEIQKMARARVKEVNGFLYGEKENGGTSTFYVSRVSFEKIDESLKERKTALRMGRVQNALNDVNNWAKGFLLSPLLGAAAAVGIVLYKRRRGNGEEK
ncbi:MAG: 4Fe-4S dicluster domain-containing protein [Deltaproteobacteria bacterium]|nr:4Fe-4S dicluster domain-containing protein [Deltaproteobacteria bacterium]